MKCPYCSTENREDRETCYHCGKDISMLRLIVNKARHHYNVALEHAERQRYEEALAELDHSLDLDSSFVPAYVVRGTVYAKMGKFEEARRCWEEALSLDPHILKAHQYIGKSKLAEQAAPLLQRLRWAVGFALALACVFILATVWQIRPSPDHAEMRKITAAIEKGDYSTALNLTSDLARHARRPEVRTASRFLEQAVRERYESAAAKVLAFLLDDKPLEAYRLCKRVTEGHLPPEPYKREFAMLEKKVVERAIDLVESWRSKFDRGEISYEELAREARAVADELGRPDLSRSVGKLLADARRAWVKRALEQAPTSAAVPTSETVSWLRRLKSLAAKAPESRDAVSSVSARLLSLSLKRLDERINKAVAAKDPDSLRAAIADLRRLLPFSKDPALGRLLEKAYKAFRQIEADDLLARLKTATIEDIPSVEHWISAFERETSTSIATMVSLAEATTRTRRRLAYEMLRWCGKRDPRYEDLRITREEARFTVERAEFVLRYIKARDWRYVRDSMIFYAGASHLKLGNADEALRWFDRLESLYPESPYVKLARNYREKIKGQAPAPETKSQ